MEVYLGGHDPEDLEGRWIFYDNSKLCWLVAGVSNYLYLDG